MTPTNPDAHIDPVCTDPAFLITNTITLKDYCKLKKKKKMNLVLFKKKRFWTINEAEEDVDKEDNHDDF